MTVASDDPARPTPMRRPICVAVNPTSARWMASVTPTRLTVADRRNPAA